jgi:glutaredoxin 3
MAAKRLLKKHGAEFTEINVSDDDSKREWLAKETGLRTTPQIFIDGRAIGGFAELESLDKSGELARRLAVQK